MRCIRRVSAENRQHVRTQEAWQRTIDQVRRPVALIIATDQGISTLAEIVACRFFPLGHDLRFCNMDVDLPFGIRAQLNLSTGVYFVHIVHRIHTPSPLAPG